MQILFLFLISFWFGQIVNSEPIEKDNQELLRKEKGIFTVMLKIYATNV